MNKKDKNCPIYRHKGQDFETKQDLLQNAQDSLLNPIERAEAADALDRLGYAPEELYSMVEIHGDEKCATFWIGKYPVTNAQYARFLKPENFADRNLWEDFPRFASPQENYRIMDSTGKAGWDWLQKELRDKGNPVEDGVLYPRYWWDTRFGAQRPSAPVVGVTWWEANAYARWLRRHWEALEEGRQGARLGLAKPALIRLPREDEWVKAASSPATSGPAAGGEADGRYAFGTMENPEEEITRFCNTSESGIRRTTPVWTYPQGASPNGAMDMSGNVWEWQGNHYDKDHDTWAYRGGSWLSNHPNARVSFRDPSFGLHDWYYGIGFRLVSLPEV
jgi:formylglycine-generating enzyme required for sulfatase activity